MILGQVFAQQVATEITIEVTPNRMDVIGVVLRGVVFEKKLRRLNPVVVAFARPLGAHPHEIGLLGIEEGGTGRDLLDDLRAVLGRVGFQDFCEPGFLA